MLTRPDVQPHGVPLSARVCVLDRCLQRVYFGLELMQLLTIFYICALSIELESIITYVKDTSTSLFRRKLSYVPPVCFFCPSPSC